MSNSILSIYFESNYLTVPTKPHTFFFKRNNSQDGVEWRENLVFYDQVSLVLIYLFELLLLFIYNIIASSS